MSDRIERLEIQVDKLKDQLAGLNNKIEQDRNIRRQELAVRLISDWATRIDESMVISRKFVEILDQQSCENIYKKEKFRVDSERYENFLKGRFADEFMEHKDGFIYLNYQIVGRIRWQIVSYLNLLEAIMIAWEKAIADPEIIEKEFLFLRSADGHSFALRNYRDACYSILNFETYPSIRLFEETNIPSRQQHRFQEDIERRIKDIINSETSRGLTKEQAISRAAIDVVEREASEPKQKYALLRLVINEGVKASLEPTVQAVFNVIRQLIVSV